MTGDDEIAARCRRPRDHGRLSKDVHAGDRLQPALQRDPGRRRPRAAAAASTRHERAALARWPRGTTARLAGLPLERPAERPGARTSIISTWCALRGERELASFLKSRGIQTGIHYPVPSHQQPAAERFAGPALPETEAAGGRDPDAADLRRPTEDEIDTVVAAVDESSSEPDDGRPSSGSCRSIRRRDFFTGARDPAVVSWRAASAARGHRGRHRHPAERDLGVRCADAGLTHAASRHAPGREIPRAAWRLARLIRQERIQIAHAHKGRARTLTLLGRAHGRPARCWSSTGASASRSTAPSAASATRTGESHAIVAVCESIKRGLVGSRRGRRQDLGDLLRHRPSSALPSGRGRRRPCVASSEPDARRRGRSRRSACGRGAAGATCWTPCPPWRQRVARARLLFVGAPPPRIARDRAMQARARGPRGAGAGRSATATTSRRSSTASDVVVDASYAGPRHHRLDPRGAWPAKRPVVGHRLEGMPELVLDGETGPAGAAAHPGALADAHRAGSSRNPPPPRPWPRPAASASRRCSRCAPRSTRPRRCTADWSPRRTAHETRGQLVYRRLLPLMRPYVLRAGAGRACWPSSWPRWRARSPGSVKPAIGRHLHPARRAPCCEIIPCSCWGAYLVKGGARYGQSYLMASVGERVIAHPAPQPLRAHPAHAAVLLRRACTRPS